MPRALWKELCSYYYSRYENICAARGARTHARMRTRARAHTHSISLPPLVEVRIVRGMTAQWEDGWHIDQIKSTVSVEVSRTKNL
jgi:hypothetical protein